MSAIGDEELCCSRPSIDQLQRLLGEARLLQIDSAMDSAFKSISQSVVSCRQWTEEARRLQEALHGCSGQPIDQNNQDLLRRIQEHVANTEVLPCRVDASLLEKLREKSTPYCLCSCVYDENRPMLGCEFCDRWFHYECVGLEPPRDDEVDDEVAPADYRCPHCCTKGAVSYPHDLPSKYAEDLARQYGRECSSRRTESERGLQRSGSAEPNDVQVNEVGTCTPSEVGVDVDGDSLANGRPCTQGPNTPSPSISPATIDEFMVALGVESSERPGLSAEDQLRKLQALEELVKIKKRALEQQLCTNGRR